jgi:hypothetical protein
LKLKVQQSDYFPGDLLKNNSPLASQIRPTKFQ